jgi:hypothetical protein
MTFRALVTILYSYSNENAITSQLIEFQSEYEREEAIKRIHSTYKHDYTYKVNITKL